MMKQLIRTLLLSPAQREYLRLKALPRYTPTQTTLEGQTIEVVDACTFLSGYQEIFEKEVYDFSPRSNSPRIVDCGANIGLSVIFFKQSFPSARITAFEPDPCIFAALQSNVESFGYKDVELRCEAVWTSCGEMDFLPEGGYSGHLVETGDGAHPVPTVRLRDILIEPIDLLKLDIEGAETEVLRDCADRLDMVHRLFVEYHSREGQPQSLAEILSILSDAGYRYHAQEAYAARKPFIATPPLAGMDFQLNIYAWRP